MLGPLPQGEAQECPVRLDSGVGGTRLPDESRRQEGDDDLMLATMERSVEDAHAELNHSHTSSCPPDCKEDQNEFVPPEIDIQASPTDEAALG